MLSTLDKPIALIALLADGSLYREQTLLKRLNLAPEILQQAICTLHDWGLSILTPTTKAYQLAVPLKRLDRQAICRYSGHSGVTLIPVLDSSNQYLLDRRKILSCGDACVTEYQYAGRGRRGNRWISPFGTGALFSMYWKLPSPPAKIVDLSVVLSIVTAEALQQLGVQDIMVKWPNDLYLNNCKLGGILIDTSTSTREKGTSLIIGAGINLYTAPPVTPSTALQDPQQQCINQRRISLQDVGINVDINQLIGTILRAWYTALQQFARQGAEPVLTRWDRLQNNHLNLPK